MTCFNATDYKQQLKALLPRGALWDSLKEDGLFNALLDALAQEPSRIDARVCDLINEADPRTTLELLTDWERAVGLPDKCFGRGTTIQERRQAIVTRLTSVGGASRAYFIGLAAALGYTITIDEFSPFMCGISRCGQNLNPNGAQITWRINIPGARLTYFRTGVSGAGERLLTINAATDLICLFKRLKPADTNLLFFYQGQITSGTPQTSTVPISSTYHYFRTGESRAGDTL